MIDGDQIMSVLAIALRERGELRQDTLVATVMSNLGMFQCDGATRASVARRPRRRPLRPGGDDAVASLLGGEQSGHVIFLDHATTGDGTLTGLLLAARVAQSGRSLRDLAPVMTRLPQVLINVTGVDKDAVDASRSSRPPWPKRRRNSPDLGRVLLRKSGTEPVVRVMVEAPTGDQAAAVATRLAQVVKAELGGSGSSAFADVVTYSGWVGTLISAG